MLRRVLLLLPCVIALLVYLPSVRSDFVYDARAQILTDDYIHEPRHFADVLTFRVLGQDVLDNDRPVHLAIYLTESLVGGRNPIGYHLTSIVLHGVNVLLLTLLIARWLSDRGEMTAAVCAMGAALLYAMHPVNVEPVAEPSFREDLLATFFTLSGLLLATREKPSVWLIPLCFFLGIASKENAIVGPPVVLAYWLIWRRGESWKRWGIIVVGSFAVVVGFLLIYRAVKPEHSHIFIVPPMAIADTKWERIPLQVRIFAFYFRNLIWPTRLSADYPMSVIELISPAVGWVVVIGFLAIEAALVFQSRLHLLAMGIFWMGIATVSNLVPIYRPIADRFLYLPLAGIAVHLALVALPLARRWPWVVVIDAILIAAPLTYLTWQRQRVFHDSIALWSDTLQHDPDSFTAHDNLAFAYYDAGDDSNAVKNWQQALKCTHSSQLAAEAFAGLSIGLDALENHSAADAAFKQAVSLAPRFGDPPSLLRDIEWERPHVAALQKIADRNRAPAFLGF